MENYPSEFDGLLHEMVPKEPFMNQETIYMNKKGDINCSTVTDYTTENLNIIGIEKKVCHVCKK